MKTIKISPADNVAVTLVPITKGEEVFGVTAREDIPQGHKIALTDIHAGERVIKYGFTIGTVKSDIHAGHHVHTHNVKTAISEHSEYTYTPDIHMLARTEDAWFDGYLRKDGSAGVRNEIWIIPTVGCVNSVAEKLAKDNADLAVGTVEGIYAFPHPYGCSQLGDDHANTRKLLVSLAKHPNAGGVLILSLGCENLTMEQFKAEFGEWDEDRVKFLVCQQSEDELAEGSRLLKELADYADSFKREKINANKLVIGLKCGGSDGLSGITANPAVGAFSDMLISKGGTTILTEVPEMFGAETILMNRCRTKELFDKTVDMINGFKDYFTSHGQTVYENPSPGNKAGGITTLEDKSLGCIQKGGTAPVDGVLGYAQRVETPGLNLMYGPGNDLVSATNLAAAGAQIVIFTTGRGTPFGCPVPTIKVSTNNALYAFKKNWIDFNAGTVAEGEEIGHAGKCLLDKVLSVASGEQTVGEKHGYRGIAIFKDGVTL